MEEIAKARKINGKYQNPVNTLVSRPGSTLDTLWKFMRGAPDKKPAHPPGPFRTDPSVYRMQPQTGLRITWMGHSSLLIEIDGFRILTDPVWSSRASFASWIGPTRFFPAPLALTDLPKIDLLLLSHDHYDHLDKKTIQQLAYTSIPVLCSEGVGPIIANWGIQRERITEITWGQEVLLTSSHRITAMPARHFSGRGLFNRNETLWSSFILDSRTHRIFFGADSGWFPGFQAIGDLYGPFDITMLEIGAYDRNWPDIHMGPENASEAHLALKGKLMMPIHWGTFDLALHPWKEPVEKILQIAKEKKIKLFLPEPGLPTEVSGEVNSGWWNGE